MVRYEVLILAVPEITQDETKNLESSVERIIREAKASVISFDRWGKYRLSYPIRKNDYGVYFLVRFEAATPGTIVNDIRTLFTVRLNDVVMRSMACALDPKQSLEYQRPLSLEDTPPREMGGYGRESRDSMSHRDDDDDDAQDSRSDRGARADTTFVAEGGN